MLLCPAGWLEGGGVERHCAVVRHDLGGGGGHGAGHHGRGRRGRGAAAGGRQQQA